jgi:hypothetical protein
LQFDFGFWQRDLFGDTVDIRNFDDGVQLRDASVFRARFLIIPKADELW